MQARAADVAGHHCPDALDAMAGYASDREARSEVQQTRLAQSTRDTVDLGPLWRALMDDVRPRLVICQESLAGVVLRWLHPGCLEAGLKAAMIC